MILVVGAEFQTHAHIASCGVAFLEDADGNEYTLEVTARWKGRAGTTICPQPRKYGKPCSLALLFHNLVAFFTNRLHLVRRRHDEFLTRTRRHRSKALLECGLVEEEQDHRWLAGGILHADPVPVRDENRGSRSCVVLMTSQGDAHRTFVDKNDFIFGCLCVGILFPGGISSVPTTRASDPVVTGSTLKIKGFWPSNNQRSPSSACRTDG